MPYQNCVLSTFSSCVGSSSCLSAINVLTFQVSLMLLLLMDNEKHAT